jgi:hypothetical protein
VIGAVHLIQPAIRATGCPFQYSDRIHGYIVPRKRIDDLAVALELAGVTVELELPGWS